VVAAQAGSSFEEVAIKPTIHDQGHFGSKTWDFEDQYLGLHSDVDR
jgi:hypothetical protein